MNDESTNTIRNEFIKKINEQDRATRWNEEVISSYYEKICELNEALKAHKHELSRIRVEYAEQGQRLRLKNRLKSFLHSIFNLPQIAINKLLTKVYLNQAKFRLRGNLKNKPQATVTFVLYNVNDSSLQMRIKKVFQSEIIMLDIYSEESDKKILTFNEALALASNELLVFVNGKSCATLQSLDLLIQSFKAQEDNVRVAAPTQIDVKEFKKIRYLKGLTYDFDDKKLIVERSFGSSNSFNAVEISNKSPLIGGTFITKKSTIGKLGGFDDGLSREEQIVDFTLRNYLDGFVNLITSEAKTLVLEQIKDKWEPSPLLQDKWFSVLFKQYWQGLINGNIKQQLEVTFIVSESGERATAGDFFTAQELGAELEKFGWRVKFKPKDEYFIDESTDAIIVMLHDYDLSKVKSKNRKLIKIAWIRNWFAEFIAGPGFQEYDLILCSSKRSKEFVSSLTGKTVYYFPIATSFHSKKMPNSIEKSEFECDYCFTGSFWNDPREIMAYDPTLLSQYKFHVYGKNWDKFSKFAPFNKNFVSYDQMKSVYSKTKLVIDDANRVTKNWGSVNSRVFDALASGTMVITNGRVGSEEVFGSKLPVYENETELRNLVKQYLSNEELRKNVVDELKNIVLKNHTYELRALRLKEILFDLEMEYSFNYA